MESKDKQHERVQIAKWLAEFPEIIGTILNRGGEISVEDCIEIIEVLEKQKMEYTVPIFIYIIQMYYQVDEAVTTIMQENRIGVWQDNETKIFYKELKRKLKRKLKQKLKQK